MSKSELVTQVRVMNILGEIHRDFFVDGQIKRESLILELIRRNPEISKPELAIKAVDYWLSGQTAPPYRAPIKPQNF